MLAPGKASQASKSDGQAITKVHEVINAASAPFVEIFPGRDPTHRIRTQVLICKRCRWDRICRTANPWHRELSDNSARQTCNRLSSSLPGIRFDRQESQWRVWGKACFQIGYSSSCALAIKR